MNNIFQDQQEYFLKARYSVWGVFALMIAIVTVYWQVWHFDFIRFDDPVYVTDTYLKVRNSDNKILWIFRFAQGDGKYWQPLTLLSHIADCHFFGLESGLHHFSNLIFHLLNSVLLFLFLKQILTDFWKSFWIALLFAIHPMNVESVAWISERKNLISTLFFFLTLLAYFSYVKNPNRVKYLVLIFVFMLGLLAKPMLITLPAILLLLDWWPFQRISFKKDTQSMKFTTKLNISIQKPFPYLVLEKIPLFLLSILAIFLTIYSVQGDQNLVPENQYSMKLRATNAITSIVVYIGKIFWPMNLAVFYPYPEKIVYWKPLIAAFLLIVPTILFLRKFRSSPYLILGWSWFLITLLPVLGIIQAGLWPAMADRWVYIPAVGLFLITIFTGEKIATILSLSRKTIFLFAIFFTSILMMISWHQVRFWQNSMSLYRQTLRATTRNYMAHNNLGNILMENGQLEQALHHFQEAIQIKPSYSEAQMNLANTLTHQGKHQEAIEQYKKLSGRYPGNAMICNNLGAAIFKTGRVNAAIPYYINAIQLKPNYAEAYNNLGVALWQNNRKSKALVMFQKALAINPDYGQAYDNMVRLISDQKKINRKLYQLMDKSAQSPDDPILLFQLGDFFQKEEKIQQAIACYQKALKLKPGWYEAKKQLSISFAMKGNYEVSFSILRDLITQNPDDADAYYNMACICSRQNNATEATQWLQVAVNKGFSDWKRIQTDSNFNNIRSNRLFQQLMADHVRDIH
jgi:protein O-mannosyl-transferase